MNKTLLIIKREFTTRVRKRSFILMTFLGPIFMAAIFIVPAWIAGDAGKSLKNIYVLNKNQIPDSVFKNSEYIHYKLGTQSSPEGMKKEIAKSEDDALVYIPKNFPDSGITMYSYQHIELELEKEISKLLESYIENKNLSALGVSSEQLLNAKQKIKTKTVKWSETGEDTTGSAYLNTIIGFVLAFVIYMFIFIYGAQVMRGVLEEKTGRIVEVLISSVKPFELMSGKIIGIALLALTQFTLWIILTFGIVSAAGVILKDNVKPEQISQTGVVNMEQTQGQTLDFIQSDILVALSDYNWSMLLVGFIFFFLTGYLLYASLFAAIGSAVDNETDTQQFTMPITVPLIISIVMAQNIINNPNGPLAFWFSIIPFTSPVVMPVRLAFDAASTWEMILSAGTIMLTIAATIWIASRIYKNGILKYGKKSSYADLFKWIKQK